MNSITNANFQDHLDAFHNAKEITFDSEFTVIIDGESYTIDEDEYIDRVQIAKTICKAMEAFALMRHRVQMIQANKATDSLFEAFRIPLPDTDDRDVQPSDC